MTQYLRLLATLTDIPQSAFLPTFREIINRRPPQTTGNSPLLEIEPSRHLSSPVPTILAWIHRCKFPEIGRVDGDVRSSEVWVIWQVCKSAFYAHAELLRYSKLLRQSCRYRYGARPLQDAGAGVSQAVDACGYWRECRAVEIAIRCRLGEIAVTYTIRARSPRKVDCGCLVWPALN